ncbi:GDSL-type esterase/lipase family protein [Streptomyces fractus]|uniref:GDSL-type esterase/lipase family protein n=1 Tax=Streptomyces fractus TaxID=641806 RepID=UPI003CEAD0A9
MPEIFILGDSVAMDRAFETARGINGWASLLPEHLSDKMRVVDRSAPHMTIHSNYRTPFISILSRANRGDILIVSSASNDQQMWNPRKEIQPSEYREYLSLYAAAAREAGIRLAFATPVARCIFDSSGRVRRSHGIYPDVMRVAAAELAVPLLDIEAATLQYWDRLGPGGTVPFFAWYLPGACEQDPTGRVDRTHLNEAGARVVARIVVASLREENLLDAEDVHMDPLDKSPQPPPMEKLSIRAVDVLGKGDPSVPSPSVSAPEAGEIIDDAPFFWGICGEEIERILFFSGGEFLGHTTPRGDGRWAWSREVAWTPGEHELQVVSERNSIYSVEGSVKFCAIANLGRLEIISPKGQLRSCGPRPHFRVSCSPEVEKILFIDRGHCIGAVLPDSAGVAKFVHPHKWRPGLHTVHVQGIRRGKSDASWPGMLSTPKESVTFRVIGPVSGNPLTTGADSRFSCGSEDCTHETDKTRWPG